MRIVVRSGSAMAGVVTALWIGLAPGWAQPSPASGQAADQAAKSATPPVPGANSFAESQARKLLQSNGYSDVSPLVNDSQGIWRGTAMSGTNKVQVSVDYKGNVSSHP